MSSYIGNMLPETQTSLGRCCEGGTSCLTLKTKNWECLARDGNACHPNLLVFLAVILIDMDSKKSLLMNVSQDEMDTIDEILQSRQTGSPVERRTCKLIFTSPQYLISVPGKVKAPVNIPIATMGALYELNTKDWESKHREEPLEIDIEKDNNYKPFHSTSKILTI
ncbi:hypothetical protein CEXT_531951 [Caerostris extrusa]|uniref:Uncharacterized protein n=1 Tax=Caerostris extrusa TaxID=172846 RepID=A0AAV4RMG4_CAEEX|nr:hypothetical protein CEXT_531951 [Caerostris extrusa]